MNKLNNFINTYKTSGNITELKSNILRNIDNSYPILKERQYPPKLYDSISNETTITFLGKSVYTRDLTLNTTGISYGSGVYTMYLSTIYDLGFVASQLIFDYNTDVNSAGIHFKSSTYNANGSYNGTNGIVSGYNGEWVILKLPNPIFLTKYEIISRNGLISRAPAEWKCYGSTDGITFIEISQASQMSRLITDNYANNIYIKSFNNSISYSYIGFTFNKLVGDGTILNFIELKLFGKETIDFINNPIIWYKFDGSSSQMLLDSSGNGYNLTNNGATYDTTNFIKGSGSVNFNHLSSQYLTIPSINLYNIQSLNGISFCLWFRMNTTNTGAYPRIFDFSNGNTTTPRWILLSRYTSTDNRLNFDIANTANSSGNRITTNNYIDGNWHHIVWSINNLGSWVIYIDGVIASFTASLPTNINIENVNFTSNSLGKSLINGDGYYDGNIDDFRIYDFVLSQSHVQELYNGRVEINHSPFQNTIIKYSSGGSGGGSYYNSNNQSYTLAKWNNNYSYISSGNNGTNFIGGNGGSSLITSTYNLTGTNQIIGIGGVGATSASASGSKSYGCGGDGNGGSGGSGVIIIKILKELRNFNLARNYLFNNGTDYPILKDNNGNNINPTAWYKFDNPSNVGFDSSGNGYHLTNNGNVSIDNINYIKGNSSVLFNGSNNLQISYTNNLFSDQSGWSLSFWVYLRKPTELVSLISTRLNDSSTLRGFNWYFNNLGDFNFQVGNDLVYDWYGYTYNALGFYTDAINFKWFHLVLTMKSGEQRIYSNGILISSGSESQIPNFQNGSSIFTIGSSSQSIYYVENGFRFDDFRYYGEGRILTQSQVLELYENSRINFIINGNSISKGTNYISSTNNYPLLTYANSNIINPIIWYKFDDSTNIGKDEMNLLNLTNSSTPVTLNTTLFTKGISSCDIATTSFLKSTSANISLYFSQKSFSISFWVYMRSSTNGFTIAIGPSVSDGGIWFGYSVNSILNTYHFGCHNSGADLNSSAIYSDVNTWVYLTFTYNINNILRCIYRNGILIASNTRVASSFTTNVFWIGRITNDTSYSMNGIIDDFRIYDFELSSSQVQELYNTTNNYTTLINYPTNYFSSYSSNFNNPFIRTSNNNLELLSYTNNNVNSLLLESNIKLITNNNNRLTFNSNIISINNSLDIKGNSGTITNQGGAYFTTDVSSSSYSNGYIPEYTNYSLKTFDNIICGKNSYALSDMRIKKNVSNIDDVSSLEKILKVEPKIYGYIDNIQRTNSNVYGFIAQQIRDILPEATELTTKFIPDIFKLVKKNGNIINLNEEDLKKIEIRDILEIYTKDNSYEVKVINKDNDGIEIDRNIKDNDIFIYGRQVKDFHIIDKSYLYTLNICATQELARIVEGLKERINNL